MALIKMWRRQLFRLWQDDRQKREAAGGGGGTPTGDGTMDFSIATGDNTALLALLEDI